MTISNSNLLKPFITGTELPPFKEDVFSKTEEQFKKSPHGKLLFISGNENLVNISAETTVEKPVKWCYPRHRCLMLRIGNAKKAMGN